MPTEIIIIGGGLAGLTNAIHLSKAGLKVLLIEKNEFPKHKICGEYISNEVIPYLDYLGIDPFAHGAVVIDQFLLSISNGKTIQSKLPLGGFGISRYRLDHLLYQKAKQQGVTILQDQAEDVHFQETYFAVKTRGGGTYEAKFVIGAFGKRSNLDVSLQRSFIQQRAPLLGVKAHYRGDFPEDLVALHNFRGGYCGVSKVENDHINICYLADFAEFKKYKNIDLFQQEVLFKNPHLKRIFSEVEPVFEKPLTISQVSFLPKKSVKQHILMSGDAAGMIHPLCGNGMGMAIHSALLLSESLIQFFNGIIKSRTQLEHNYSQKWKATFSKRLKAGRLFNAAFRYDRLFAPMLKTLVFFPDALPFFIRQTHGKPIVPSENLVLKK